MIAYIGSVCVILINFDKNGLFLMIFTKILLFLTSCQKMSLFRAAALYLALHSSLFNQYFGQSHSQIELDIFASL